MGLDYSKGCVNFRDVGEFVNLLSSSEILNTGLLFRGGKIDHVRSSDEIGKPRSIVNLRKGPDREAFGAEVFHFPVSNDLEKYETSNKEVRRWLNHVIQAFAEERLPYPALIHCTSGKDRTGVVVAALLRILEIEDELIIEEYLLSDGETRREWIETSLAGIGEPEKYFNRVKSFDSMRRRMRA